MTYKNLSTRTTPDGVLFVTVEYNFGDEIYTAEVPIPVPSDEQRIIEGIINHGKSEKWRRDAIANLPNLAASLPLNQEITIE
jgi:hypothetical protein